MRAVAGALTRRPDPTLLKALRRAKPHYVPDDVHAVPGKGEGGLPQDSADRREPAMRRTVLRHER